MDTADATEEELARASSAYRNRGRWGADDRLGTLNFLDDGKRAHAAGLIRRGRPVSLAAAGARWHTDGHTPEGFSGRGVLLDVSRAVAGPRAELPDGFEVTLFHSAPGKRSAGTLRPRDPGAAVLRLMVTDVEAAVHALGEAGVKVVSEGGAIQTLPPAGLKAVILGAPDNLFIQVVH